MEMIGFLIIRLHLLLSRGCWEDLQAYPRYAEAAAQATNFTGCYLVNYCFEIVGGADGGRPVHHKPCQLMLPRSSEAPVRLQCIAAHPVLLAVPAAAPRASEAVAKPQ